MQAWKKVTGQMYLHFPMSLTPQQLCSLPTILIQCQVYSLDIDPSTDDYNSILSYSERFNSLLSKDLLIPIPATR